MASLVLSIYILLEYPNALDILSFRKKCDRGSITKNKRYKITSLLLIYHLLKKDYKLEKNGT